MESRVRAERADQAESSPPQSSEPSIPPAIFQPGAPGYPELSRLRLPSPGPSGPPAATATTPRPSSPPALTPLYLNRALDLEDSPIRIYGFIENSYNGDTNGLPRNRTNFSIFPDHLSDQWMGNQYYLVMDDPLEGSDQLNVGFRVDFLFGNDWQVTKAYGLFDNAFPINHFPGIDLPQLYAEAHLPVLTPGGIDLRGPILLANRLREPARRRKASDVNGLFAALYTVHIFRRHWHRPPERPAQLRRRHDRRL